jgi:hypothetical protein
MFLCYRGLSYQAQSSPSTQSNKKIKFRGVSYTIPASASFNFSTPKKLKYRGTSYTI